jgi:hypothetical protein
VSFLAIFQLLSEVLAAAPSVEADVETALNAFHSSNSGNPAKIQAVVDATQHIAAIGGAIASQAAMTPPGTPATPAA